MTNRFLLFFRSFLWAGKILDDSSLPALIHADGMGCRTRKYENGVEFLFYGPTTPKIKEQTWQTKNIRNGHGEAMNIVP